MYTIAVCDDEMLICSQIEQVIIDSQKLLSNKIDIDVYYSGEELYDFLLSGIKYDMIFLDIELELLNGVSLGEKIREELNNENVQIVFISGKQGYAMELFKIRPFNFLVKPLSVEDIINVVDKGIKLSNKLNQYFIYKQGHIIKKILIQNIIYFESLDRKVKLYTSASDEVFYGSLSEVYKQVEKYQFLKIHKSFLVNYNQIIEFYYDHLLLSNMSNLPISQSKRKEVRKIQMVIERENTENGIIRNTSIKSYSNNI